MNGSKVSKRCKKLDLNPEGVKSESKTHHQALTWANGFSYYKESYMGFCRP
jgi:hypothetical protein